MIGAALLASLAAAPASAQDVLIYYNGDEIGSTSAYSGLSNAITAAGGTISSSRVRGSTSWPTSYSSSVKLIIFLLPPDSFNSAEAAAVANVVKYGGRVVVTGDWSTPPSGYGTENNYVNTLLSGMGMSMRVQDAAIFGSGCDDSATVNSDTLTDSVGSLWAASSGEVTGGTSLLDFGTKSLLAVEELPGAAGSRDPYDVIVSGDTNLLLDGCSGSSSSSSNYGFWTNLYTGLCADDDGDGYTDSTCGGTDCDDSDPLSYPSASESCDGADNDCDSSIDEGVTTLYYRDADNDTYGDAATTTLDCSVPSGYATNSSDCDDGDATVYPGASETCDGDDEDCDYSID